MFPVSVFSNFIREPCESSHKARKKGVYMKIYNVNFTDTVNEEFSSETIIVGTASEIRPVYKAFVRAFNAGCRTSLIPTFCDFPRFVEDRYYGISNGRSLSCIKSILNYWRREIRINSRKSFRTTSQGLKLVCRIKSE